MGTQIHAGDNYRRVVELVQGGAIGPVREAHVWVSRAWGLQSEEAADAEQGHRVRDRPADGSRRVPPDLDWDLWLGPAPERPFHPVYVPGPKWYRWWDFGSGTMSDLGSHWNDLPFWALKLQAPLTIEATGGPPHPEIAPASMTATYEYAAARRHAAGDADLAPGREQAGDLARRPHPAVGATAACSSATRACCWPTTASTCCCPRRTSPTSSRPSQTIAKSPGHHAEWINAVQDRQPDDVQLRVFRLADRGEPPRQRRFRVGKKLEWDAATMKATNAPEADQFLRREYRKGGQDTEELALMI